MTKHEIRQVRIFFFHHSSQGVFILHHSAETGIAPIAPGIVHHSGFSMTHMVVGGYNKPGVHQFHNHMKIPSGMLAKPMHQLHDALRLRCRHINPALHSISLIIRRKAYFM